MVKTYILRRYSIDELDDILYNKLNIQSRNLKNYNDKSLSFFMNSVVNSITNTILEELTDGWVEDSPVSEDDLYEFIKRIFENRIKDRYMELTDIGLRENIQRIKEVMGLKEQSFLQHLADRVKKQRQDAFPYKEKKYNPDNNGNFSDSVVKDVVWRAGEFGFDHRSGGIWFAESKEDVEKFALSVRNEKREGKPYRINLQNPYYFNNFWNSYIPEAENHGRDGLMYMLAMDGHDGMIIGRDTWNDTADENSVTSKQYVVFNPENIKPA